MRKDSRLSRMLHVLLHMEHATEPMTSDAIASMFDTNPVVVRRTLANLRRAGYVTATRGHGGGWSLARPLAEITLLDIYNALGAPALFAFGLSDDAPTCLVEREVNATLTAGLNAARRQLLDGFAQLTLADIARGVDARAAAAGLPSPTEWRHRNDNQGV